MSVLIWNQCTPWRHNEGLQFLIVLLTVGSVKLIELKTLKQMLITKLIRWNKVTAIQLISINKSINEIKSKVTDGSVQST